MNLDYLRTFMIAADVGSFSQAARHVHLSQAAVSLQIRELESRLGVTLFERSKGRRLQISPAGERLLPLAQHVVKAYRDLEQELSAFKGLSQGVIQLGATSTPGIYLMPYALDAFARQMPGVKVSLHVLDLEPLRHALRNGELDLAVSEEEIQARDLPKWDRDPLLEDELVIITPPLHPWASRQEVELQELFDEPFILRPQDSSIRKLQSNLLAARGFDPEQLKCRFELGSTEAIKHAVLAGLGLGFVSRSAIGQELAAGTLSEVRIKGVSLGRPLWLLKPVDRKFPRHQQQLIDLLQARSWLPSILRQRLHAERTVQIVEVRITNPQLDQTCIQDLKLPRNCLVALIKRKGAVSVPDGQTALELGDTLTLIGIHEVVEEARQRLER